MLNFDLFFYRTPKLKDWLDPNHFKKIKNQICILSSNINQQRDQIDQNESTHLSGGDDINKIETRVERELGRNLFHKVENSQK